MSARPQTIQIFLPGGDPRGIRVAELTKGYYTEEGFVVLAGSVGRRESVPSIKGTSDERFGSSRHYRFDRQSLLLPDVLIPVEVMPGRGMRPAYDLMCQSAGMEGSANYGPDGEWKASQ